MCTRALLLLRCVESAGAGDRYERAGGIDGFSDDVGNVSDRCEGRRGSVDSCNGDGEDVSDRCEGREIAVDVCLGVGDVSDGCERGGGGVDGCGDDVKNRLYKGVFNFKTMFLSQ